MKILIAEDTEDSRVLLEVLLAGSGYEVKSGENGLEALARITENFLPDLIISDILMPEMDGYALCRILKKDERLRRIPFIFYTATYTEPGDKEFALSLGADRFLIKPMEMPEFLSEIETVLREDEQKNAPLIAPPEQNDKKMEENYSAILAKKLDHKVRQLEAEKKKLQKSEQKYRRLVEGLQNNYVFYTHDIVGFFTYLSPSISTVLGHSPEEFAYHYTRYLTDNPINREGERLTDLCMQGEKQPPYELEVFHADGSIRRLEITEEPIFDNNDQVIAVEGIAHDITERHLAAEALAEARDEWEKTFHAIDDPVLILDPQMRVMRTNQAASELVNVDAKKDLTGEYCYELYHESDHPCSGCPVVATIRTSQPSCGEVEHKKLSKTFLVSAAPRFDSSGKLVSIVHSAKDITEQKMLENQLRQAQKMEAVGTLAGGIAHDFNNILTAIIGYSELLKLQLPPDSREQNNANQVLIAGNRAKNLVSQILTFSRQAEQERKPVKIQHIIKEAMLLLRSTIPITIEFRQQINQNCEPVLADPTRMHQIIMNLCTNAYHAMREQCGILTVALDEEEIQGVDHTVNSDIPPGRYVRLEVSDTGDGIENRLLDKIFDPYFTTRKKGEGTGLGLAMVNGIVKKFSGHIKVTSEPEKGTSFQVYFPVATSSYPAAEQVASSHNPQGNERILFVDDEQQIAALEAEILTRYGYRVTSFSDPVAAFQLFQDQPDDFDLVITDMSMPQMTGAELAEKMMAIRKDIPIILCTGFSDIINREKAQAMGIRHYVMKPVITDEFVGVIRGVLDS